MNIRCPFHPFRTLPYSCIWLHSINIFGTGAGHIRIIGIVRLCYHRSSETIREAAENNWKNISERLVQEIEGERERKKTQGPQKIRKKEKRLKTRRTNSAPHRKKKEKSPTPKREEEENKKQGKETKNNTEKRRRIKKKKRREKKRKKEVTQLNSKKKKEA